MPKARVLCHRELEASAEAVWQLLRGFGLNWHPLVASCTVYRDTTGGLRRAFQGTDGSDLVDLYLGQITVVANSPNLDLGFAASIARAVAITALQWANEDE